jgi:hypothetical protein
MPLRRIVSHSWDSGRLLTVAVAWHSEVALGGHDVLRCQYFLSLPLAHGFNMTTPPVHSEVFSSIVDVLPGGVCSGYLSFVASFLSGPLPLSVVEFLVWCGLRLSWLPRW